MCERRILQNSKLILSSANLCLNFNKQFCILFILDSTFLTAARKEAHLVPILIYQSKDRSKQRIRKIRQVSHFGFGVHEFAIYWPVKTIVTTYHS